MLQDCNTIEASVDTESGYLLRTERMSTSTYGVSSEVVVFEARRGAPSVIDLPVALHLLVKLCRPPHM